MEGTIGNGVIQGGGLTARTTTTDMIKDGMVMVVWIFLVLQDLIIMELSVFAQNFMIIVYLGNILMAKNVFITKIHALKGLDGIGIVVFLQMNAHLDFIKKIINAFHFLKVVYLLCIKIMENVQFQEINAHKVRIIHLDHVILILLVKTCKKTNHIDFSFFEREFLYG